jgi:hypothetical protein
VAERLEEELGDGPITTVARANVLRAEA